MGTVSFLVPDPLSPAQRAAVEVALHTGGYDATPVPTRRTVGVGRLTLTRDASDSGTVGVPWPLAGVPDGTLSLTSTLRERPEPYHLLLELARGRVNRLRTQLAEWGQIGFQPEPADDAELAALSKQFGRLALDPAAPTVTAAAEDCLARAYHLADRLARTFARQLRQTRHAEAGRLPTRLAVRTDRPLDFRDLATRVTAVRAVPDWRQIEPTESGYDWATLDAILDGATAAGLPVSVGPILDLAGGRVPDWLLPWAGDFPSLAAFTCDFVETVVRRYQGRVRTWVPVGGFNQADALGLAEDDRIRLAARLLEAAGKTDPGGELVLTVGQPWGDYLTDEAYTYSPLVFADTLMRAGFQFAALDLELVAGPPPAGSRPRDALEAYRLLDLFAVLGLPLELTAGGADWPRTAVEVAAALPQVRQVTWVADDRAGAADPGGLFAGLRRDEYV
jgi:hypothetical protein